LLAAAAYSCEIPTDVGRISFETFAQSIPWRQSRIRFEWITNEGFLIIHDIATVLGLII